MDTKVIMSQQGTLAAKNNSFLVCVRQNINSECGEVILPLCSGLLRHIRSVQAPQYRRDMDLLGKVQQRATKIVKSLEHMRKV